MNIKIPATSRARKHQRIMAVKNVIMLVGYLIEHDYCVKADLYSQRLLKQYDLKVMKKEL